jgi:hypothetical protein
MRFQSSYLLTFPTSSFSDFPIPHSDFHSFPLPTSLSLLIFPTSFFSEFRLPIFSSSFFPPSYLLTFPTSFFSAFRIHTSEIINSKILLFSNPKSAIPNPKSAIPNPQSYQSVSVFSTAKKADCGIITLPTIFMRFLPFFCFSSNLRLRVISPP